MRVRNSAQDLSVETVAMPSSFVQLTAADAAGERCRCLHERRRDHGYTSERLEWRNCACLWPGAFEGYVEWCVSRLEPKCPGFASGLEHADFLRVVCGEPSGDVTKIDQHETCLQATDAICVNDCMSFAAAFLGARAAASKGPRTRGLRLK